MTTCLSVAYTALNYPASGAAAPPVVGLVVHLGGTVSRIRVERWALWDCSPVMAGLGPSKRCLQGTVLILS